MMNCLRGAVRRSYSTKQTIMNVFDRNSKRNQKNLASVDPEYKNYEYWFEEVGYRVADRVFDVKRSFNKILDLGSSRGYVSKHLTKETVKKIIMLEMADKVLVMRLILGWHFSFNTSLCVVMTRHSLWCPKMGLKLKNWFMMRKMVYHLKMRV